MNEQTRTHCQHLLYVLRAPPQLREDILVCPSFLLVTTFCELALNLLYGELHLTDEDKEVLRSHKELLERLVERSVKYETKVDLLRTAEPSLFNKLRDVLERYV